MPPRDPACLQLQPTHLHFLRGLLTHYTPDAEVWAYGSRVNGGCHETSDLDLELPDGCDDSAYLQALEQALETLENRMVAVLRYFEDQVPLPK